MTTIAYRDGVVAADSAETGVDGVIMRCDKLFRKKFGKRNIVIATAGDTYSGMVFVDWYGSGKPAPGTLTSLGADEDFEVLVFDRGEVWTCNHLCCLVEVIEPYVAIGSGRAHAVTAMDCGRSAKEAVRLACLRNSYSRLPISTMTVSVNPRRVTTSPALREKRIAKVA